MPEKVALFAPPQAAPQRLLWGDIVILVGLAALLYFGISLAVHTPDTIRGPSIALSPAVLPYYAALSLLRMSAAYLLSLAFALLYGRAAARNQRLERVLMPLLDVLQSVPILSFLPVVLLSLSALLPQQMATELAAVMLIFTSQVWNLVFAWYQSLKTVPNELREASRIFRFTGWQRFTTLELPFAAISLIWNSVMSWAGGWFFLMAAEMFTVGQRDFRLPGLGSYLRAAADQGDLHAIVWGLVALVGVVVLLDQLIWRPLLAWSERFKLAMVAGEAPPTAWLYNVLRSSRLMAALQRWLGRGMVWLDRLGMAWSPVPEASPPTRLPWGMYGLLGFGGLVFLYGSYRAWAMLLLLFPAQWLAIVIGVGATLLRVGLALLLTLAWTLPVGVAIGTRPRLAAWLQPLAQIAASVPATALFPVVVLVLLRLPAGMQIAAVLLMLMGTQWYVLFNVIAGASAMPQDLQYTAQLLQLRRWERWRILILPALFPYVITGAVTASGGAWNASIVAEFFDFQGTTRSVTGIGSLIAQATASGDYPLLLAATLAMILTVSTINRLVWRRLYTLAAERYRLE